ncbi:hypothetical protein [Nocardia spumae]|uniref:hypothetical protein n=1 Tax=Nocardia spumae TaxID=2887190 RepID=UPI001D14271A|nr:hypothetical protein [Nocardia spumae]
MTEATAELLAEIGGPPEVIAQLDQHEAATILALFACARQNQRRSLDRAIDDALGVLPRLIRIPARKILFGK